MDTLINILLVVLVAIFAWIRYKQYISHKYKYRFLEIRDKLRAKAIEGSIKKFWYFDYLDFVLTKHSTELENLTVWHVIGIGLRRRNSKEVDQFRTKLSTVLDTNKEFNAIYKEYSSTLSQFLIKKHFITFILVTIAGLPVIGSLLFANSYIQKAKNKLKNNLNELINIQEENIPQYC